MFTATTAGTFTSAMTAASASGGTATASVTLKVVDVRCGSKNDKVLVCHCGNTLCVASEGVAAHLGHGNQLGVCPAARPAEPVAIAGGASELALYPNPAGDQATVSFRPLLDGKAQVMVHNALGQRVASLYEGKVGGGQLYAFPLHSQTLATGLYEYRAVELRPRSVFALSNPTGANGSRRRSQGRPRGGRPPKVTAGPEAQITRLPCNNSPQGAARRHCW